MREVSESPKARVLIVGRTKRISVESGLYRAMTRMGHTVAHVDDRKLRQLLGRGSANRWLRTRVRAFRPQHVFFFKPHDVFTETIAWIAQHTRAVMWYRDLTVPPDPELVPRARLMETVFLTAGGQAQEWRDRGERPGVWLPNAADRDLDQPGVFDPAMACDIAFIGRGYDEHRADFLCRLAEKYKVRVWGQQWDRWAKQLNWDGTVVFEKDFGRVAASARIMIDIMPSFWETSQVGVYSSNRMVRTLAVGGFSLTPEAPGLREQFLDGEHCAWYRNETEAFARIDRYLNDEAARAHVCRTGQAFVREHHMLDNRVHNLLTGAPYVNPLAAS